MEETLYVFEVRDSGPDRTEHFSKSAFCPTPEEARLTMSTIV